MFKNGFRFEITKNGNIGEITGVSTTGIYSVVFFDKYGMYLRADVTEGTIRNKLEAGVFKAL